MGFNVKSRSARSIECPSCKQEVYMQQFKGDLSKSLYVCSCGWESKNAPEAPSTEKWWQLLSVTCPKCGAKQNEHCDESLSSMGVPHEERWKAYLYARSDNRE